MNRDAAKGFSHHTGVAREEMAHAALGLLAARGAAACRVPDRTFAGRAPPPGAPRPRPASAAGDERGYCTPPVVQKDPPAKLRPPVGAALLQRVGALDEWVAGIRGADAPGRPPSTLRRASV